METTFNWRDWAVRTLWTAVAATLAAIPTAAVLDTDVWQTALVQGGLTTLLTAVLVLARQRAGID